MKQLPEVPPRFCIVPRATNDVHDGEFQSQLDPYFRGDWSLEKSGGPSSEFLRALRRAKFIDSRAAQKRPAKKRERATDEI